MERGLVLGCLQWLHCRGGASVGKATRAKRADFFKEKVKEKEKEKEREEEQEEEEKEKKEEKQRRKEKKKQ